MFCFATADEVYICEHCEDRVWYYSFISSRYLSKARIVSVNYLFGWELSPRRFVILKI